MFKVNKNKFRLLFLLGTVLILYFGVFANAKASSKEIRDKIVKIAKEQVGTFYEMNKFGGWPPGLDCSGLVNYSYSQAGIICPRDFNVWHCLKSTPEEHGATAYYQATRLTTPIDVDNLLPGDLVFMHHTYDRNGKNGTNDDLYTHVGIYIGDNQVVEAVLPKVTIYPLSRWTSSPNFAGARRVKKEFWPNQDNGYSEETTQNENREESLVQNIPWWKKFFAGVVNFWNRITQPVVHFFVPENNSNQKLNQKVDEKNNQEKNKEKIWSAEIFSK